MARIFINYRRDDDPGTAGRLFDRLSEVFSRDALFIDVDDIPAGEDFVRVLDEMVARCDVVLVVIGRGWFQSRDAGGQPRLANPDDFVRIEIEAALRHGKRVIPVLVNGAEMPRPEQLPDSLKPLARRNAARVSHERFGADVQGLVSTLETVLAVRNTPRVAAQSSGDAGVASRSTAPSRVRAERALAFGALGWGVGMATAEVKLTLFGSTDAIGPGNAFLARGLVAALVAGASASRWTAARPSHLRATALLAGLGWIAGDWIAARVWGYAPLPPYAVGVWAGANTMALLFAWRLGCGTLPRWSWATIGIAGLSAAGATYALTPTSQFVWAIEMALALGVSSVALPATAPSTSTDSGLGEHFSHLHPR
ncbi:MAG TPA: toll/interleukin-1 receptor domain-containing protein [Candidatus Binatia bacterium]|nr:toll/interleukin-1 receptor domain-containing protein [Candidatus Binatia bacterium]